MKKIVYISTDIFGNLDKKRIEEFISYGYHVEIYGFSRGQKPRELPYSYTLLGNIVNTMPYINRTKAYILGLRRIKESYRYKDVVYYLSGQDSALFGFLVGLRPYIFQEADLSYTYIKSSIVRNLFDGLYRRIIRKSKLSVLTSKGFAEYHFGDELKWPKNICFVTNRLPTDIIQQPYVEKATANVDTLRIGFVGAIRFKSVSLFAEYFATTFPIHQMHFYGFISQNDAMLFEPLKKLPNVFFHGKFSSPEDLSSIYSQIDLVLATYDVNSANVRYAEPNKLYESIYFTTPIIVSKGTYLARKVKKMNIGYDVDPTKRDDVVQLVNQITSESIRDKQRSAQKLGKTYCLNENDEFRVIMDKIVNINCNKK